MTTRVTSACLAAVAQGIINLLDAGGNSNRGIIEFYTGTMPGVPGGGISGQTKLGTLTLNYPCAVVAGSSIVFNTISQDNEADATGTATWARFLNSSGVVALEGDVSNLGGSGAVRLNTVDIVAGGPIRINSAVLNIISA